MTRDRQQILKLGMVVIAAIFLGAGCRSTGAAAAEGVAGQVFFGQSDRGPGLYLLDIAEPSDAQAPHLTVAGVTDELDLAITVANGYGTEILLGVPDADTFTITNISSRFSRDDYDITVTSSPLYLAGLLSHQRFESLGGRRGVNGQVSCCGCTVQYWRLHRRLVFRPSLADADTSGSAQDDDGKVLTLPAEAQVVELRLAMKFRYLVSGDPRWHAKEVALRVRLLRQAGAGKTPASDPAREGGAVPADHRGGDGQ